MWVFVAFVLNKDCLAVAIDLAASLLLQEVFLVFDLLDAAEPVAEYQSRAAQGSRLGGAGSEEGVAVKELLGRLAVLGVLLEH